MKNLKNELSTRLKEYLVNNILTQKDFADKLNASGYNITPTAVSLWLSGLREPRFD